MRVVLLLLILVFHNTRGEASTTFGHAVIEGKDYLDSSMTSHTGQTHHRTTYVGSVSCYKEQLTPQLDAKILLVEMVDTRLKIQDRLALLERFYVEIDRGAILSSSCLADYHQWANSPLNLEGLRTCNDQLDSLYLNPLIQNVTSLGR
jgi:hypothetical protein